MSVTGKSQDNRTTASSWEVLDLPVSIAHQHGGIDKEETHTPLSSDKPNNTDKNVDSRSNERSIRSREKSHIFQCKEDMSSIISGVSAEHESEGCIKMQTPRETSHIAVTTNSLNTPPTDTFWRKHDSFQKPSSDQTFEADVIGEDIVQEFEAYARKSRAVITTDVEKEQIVFETKAALDEVNNDKACIFSEKSGPVLWYNTSQETEGIKHESSQSEMAREVTFTQEQSALSEFETLQNNTLQDGLTHSPVSTTTERQNTDESAADSTQKVLLINQRGHVVTVRDDANPKHHQKVNANQNTRNTLYKGQRFGMNKDGSRTKKSKTEPNTTRNGKGSSRPVPDGFDNTHLKQTGFVNQTHVFPLGYTSGPYGYATPVFHPPPAPQQNGITRENLMDVLSKGLGDFTNEMAMVIVGKLKPENESLADRVGSKVKCEAITELNVLKARVAQLEEENAGLVAERDQLKIEIVKERDHLKAEFEKERRKLTKEIEDTSELVLKLRKENEKIEKDMKEKESISKKATLRAKNQEEKIKKIEEGYNTKVKELTKQLDKAKGDLLVYLSKKRLKTTSAKEREKTHLVSHHGTTFKQLNRPRQEPYAEGD